MAGEVGWPVDRAGRGTVVGDVPGATAGAARGRHRPMEVPRPPLLELPSSLRGARWVPSRSAALGVLLVVGLVVLVFGARVWLAGGDREVPVGARADSLPAGVTRGTSTLSRASPTGSVGGPAGAAASGGASATVAASGAAAVVVHVVGQVRTPGVYRMGPGARVGDAVTAAGGATRSADLASLNLARVLVDGEQVLVPRPGERVPVAGAPSGAGTTPGGSHAGSTGGAGVAAGGAGQAGTVSLNTADLAALDTLPGVGPVLAQRILDWRSEHGRFTSVEELGEVSGIGEKLLAQLTPKVTL